MRGDAVFAAGLFGWGLDLALGDHIDDFTNADFFLGGDVGGGEIGSVAGEVLGGSGGVAGDDAGALVGGTGLTGRATDDEVKDTDEHPGDDEPVEFAEGGVDFFDEGFSHVHTRGKAFAAVCVPIERALAASQAGFDFFKIMAHMGFNFKLV